MSLGAITERVTVATETPLIEASAVEMSRVVTSVEIESLPISGRNFVDFVKLSSGVAAGRETGVGSCPSRVQISCRAQSGRGVLHCRAGPILYL
jgi:hypothetical protein